MIGLFAGRFIGQIIQRLPVGRNRQRFLYRLFVFPFYATCGIMSTVLRRNDAVALGAKPSVVLWMTFGLAVAVHRFAIASSLEASDDQLAPATL